MMSPANDDAELIVAALADLQAGAFPLPAALRVIAGEMDRPAWRSAFESLAAAVEKGTTLPQALELPDVSTRLPAHLQTLLKATAAGNSVTATLDMLAYHRTARAERQSLLRALAYPTLVLVLACVIGLLAAWLVTTQFMTLFLDFGLELPRSTQFVHQACQGIVWGATYLLPLGVIALVLVRWLGGKSALASLLPLVPLLGKTLHWSAIAELLRVTSRLIDEGISLPQAFRSAAAGQTNAFVADEAGRLAEEIERGMSLPAAWWEHPQLPESLAPMLRLAVGERQSGRVLRAAAKMLSTRVEQRIEVLKTILPPLLFLVVGLLIFAVIHSTLVPMLGMLRSFTFDRNSSLDSLTEPVPVGFNLTILFLPALCMLLTIHILYGHRRVMNPLRRWFTLGAYVLMLLALSGLVTGFFGGWAVMLNPTGLFVLFMIWIRFRRGEDRSLLNGLALAAEEQIPLVEMTAAFAAERRGGRAKLVERALQRGMPLSKALRAGGIALPAGARAAIALGEERGEFGPLLRESLEPFANFDVGLNRLVQRLSIWLVMIGFGSGVYLAIMKTWPRLLAEFGIGDPVSDSWIGTATKIVNDCFEYPEVSLPFGLLTIIGCFLIFLTIFLQQLGFSPNWIPFIPWLRRRYDSAVILQTLAAGIRANLPLPTVLRLLAETHPVRSIRSRLRRALTQTEAGAEGWQTLQKNGLLRPRETAALQSAGRVGNLAFVLQALSQTIIRRLEYKLHVGTNVLHFLGLIVLGTLAVLATISVIYPLALLTSSLSGVPAS